MHTLRPASSVILCFLVLTIFTACQYQPSSLARTEIPLYIPPTANPGTSVPVGTSTLAATLAAVTTAVNTPTPETEEQQECQLSTDPDYGFSPDNPIQVGSNHLSDGPDREVIYLLTLRGPNGEEVFYTRQSPKFNQADTIVDPYLIEYDGIIEPLMLYFDLYHYAPLLVPLGFTCEAVFPIQPPQE